MPFSRTFQAWKSQHFNSRTFQGLYEPWGIWLSITLTFRRFGGGQHHHFVISAVFAPSHLLFKIFISLRERHTPIIETATNMQLLCCSCSAADLKYWTVQNSNKHECHSINKLQNGIVLLIFKIMQNLKYTFCMELNSECQTTVFGRPYIGRAYGTACRLSVCRCLWRFVLWQNGAS